MTPALRETHRQPTGSWWRFSRYELTDGYIRPARDAALEEFDPNTWLASGKADCPPYLELVRLVHDIPTDRLPGPVPIETWPVELREGVLEWCRRYGLLGLLPHTLLSARLGAWQLHRAGSSWVTSTSELDEAGYDPPWGEVVENDFGDGVNVIDEDHGWQFYFPPVPVGEVRGEQTVEDRHAQLCLVPGSEEFWRRYAEPFEYFVRIACYLRNALRVISEPTKSVEEYNGVKLDYDGAVARLNALAAPISAGIGIDNRRRYRPIWHSPSLLGYLAMHAIQDLLGERRILACPCGELFASTHHAATYCSETCAARYRKRAERARAATALKKKRSRSAQRARPKTKKL